ncbi:unnamed protein product [Kuraishia capsulata CBS 1993]|uniref:WD repeat-containing protein 48 n=1 Tax=Kuraishia capsulata CBS 1993 TaxID=1382522 RepID=W6MRB6_9ASCO|nr:uncharacterized protein KUCA_T00004893001 [Kuraishia capsulata CBS 1993]CDK28908.1 unnamed protein product [Kuraishia capsulata CBS 1993]
MSRNKGKREITYALAGAHENAGHSLGVNSLVYSSSSKTLFSAGRDGVVASWGPTEDHFNSQDRQLDEYDTQYNTFEDIDNFVKQNSNNENEILSLEYNIRKGLDSLPADSQSNYQLKTSMAIHTNWINDIKLLKDNVTLATCSSDLMVKLYNAKAQTVHTLGHHDDYVKSLALGHNLVSGGLDKKVNVWDIQKSSVVSSYHHSGDRGSVYALDAKNDIIISGGPDNLVKLFDARDMKRPVRSFVGHHDNVRSLALKNNYFLSGSSDSTIKLWCLRTNRILRNFDTHNSSVISLYADGGNEERFDSFYSGDTSGCLLKTDLLNCNYDMADELGSNATFFHNKMNENLGITTLVSQMPNSECGVLSIAVGDNRVWTSSAGKSKSVQGKDNCFISSWSIPLTNKLVLYQGIKFSKNMALLKKNENEIESIDGNGDELFDLVSQLSHDTKGYDHLKNIDGILVEDSSFLTYFLSSSGGASSEFILDAASSPSISDDDDETNLLSVKNRKNKLEILYETFPPNSIRLVPFNEYPINEIIGYNGLIKARLLNDRRHVMTMDSAGKIRLWDIIQCKALDTTYECSSDDEFDIIIQQHQTFETLPIWCKVQVMSGKLFISLSESAFINTEIYADEVLKNYPDCHYKPTEEEDESLRFNIGKVVLKSLLHDFVKYELAEDAKFRETKKGLPQPRKPRTTSVASEVSLPKSDAEEKTKKRNFFSRQKSNDISTPTPANVTSTSLASQSTNGARRDSEESITDTKSLITSIRNRYESFESTSLVSAPDSEVPYLNLPEQLTLLITESTGNSRVEIFQTALGLRKNDPSLYGKLEDFLPDWVGNAILLNKYPTRDLVKVGFVLLPDPDDKDLPEAKGAATRLTAYNMLRVKKILGFIVERFDPAVSEGKRPEEWLQISCKGELLPLTMTLSTVKARIWKNSGDVELVYRIKREKEA